MFRGTIRQSWASYRANVIPADAPEIQLKECRRAFYGGAQAVLRNVVDTLTTDGEPTEEELSYVASLQAELHAFGEAVEAGRA
jgi:hypothetical protein